MPDQQTPGDRLPQSDADKLRSALYLAALEEARENELPGPEPVPPPSSQTLARIRAAVRGRGRARLSAALRVAAAAIAILLIGGGTALALSPDIRVMVLRLLYRTTPQYTEILLKEDEAAAFDVPSAWPGEYYPSYIPQGYRFQGVSGGDNLPNTNYTNPSVPEKLLIFSESSSSAVSRIDTEGYTIEQVSLHGVSALLAYKPGHSWVVWSQANKALSLSVTEDQQTALKIAESVMRIK